MGDWDDLRTAIATARAHALEEAAAWHDLKAAFARDGFNRGEGEITHFAYAAQHHTTSAAAIRALAKEGGDA